MPDDDRSEKEDGSLGIRDYVALFVAILQTVALPFVVLIIILLVILAVVSVTR
jgi:hypothetical protein